MVVGLCVTLQYLPEHPKLDGLKADALLGVRPPNSASIIEVRANIRLVRYTESLIMISLTGRGSLLLENTRWNRETAFRAFAFTC